MPLPLLDFHFLHCIYHHCRYTQRSIIGSLIPLRIFSVIREIFQVPRNFSIIWRNTIITFNNSSNIINHRMRLFHHRILAQWHHLLHNCRHHQLPTMWVTKVIKRDGHYIGNQRARANQIDMENFILFVSLHHSRAALVQLTILKFCTECESNLLTLALCWTGDPGIRATYIIDNYLFRAGIMR